MGSYQEEAYKRNKKKKLVEGSGDIHEGIAFWSPFNFRSPMNKDA